MFAAKLVSIRILAAFPIVKTVWSQIVFILTLRCDQASVLISDSFDRKLLFYERLALRGHYLACKSCPFFRKQMEFVRRAMRHGVSQRHKESQTDLDASESRLSDEAKQRIVNAMRNG